VSTFGELGPNSGLVEEMYREYVENPESVSESWRDFFADYIPRGAPENGGSTRVLPAPVAGVPVAADLPDAPEPVRPASDAVVLEGEEATTLRGAAARTVENMQASLGVPTATSVRAVPAKLLEVNRQILNNHLARTGGGKVSFTHLIAYAIVKALGRMPVMNASYGLVDGNPSVVRHDHVNLGLAVDIQKSDGSHSLLVPNLKGADRLDFAGLFAAYEDVIRRVRGGQITPDDFAGTTVTITNPGMIGTVHSIPRLMPGQSLIVGVGTIEFPAEYQGADRAALARIGVSKTVTLTSTYDHRIVSGAESGEFLRWVHELLLGEDGFYDEVFSAIGVPYEPARWQVDDGIVDEEDLFEKVVGVHQLINMYRVRGHLIANLDPLGRRPPHTHPELDIGHYGLTIWDLDREFPVGSLGAGDYEHRSMPLREILGVLRDAYARTIGVEYMHIQEPDQKDWIQARVETRGESLKSDDQRRILQCLNGAEAFERFLHTKYLGHKRFSLEGAETLIPMVDALFSAAADDGAEDAVLGMAHRGRLTVLATIIHKGYEKIFREFEGEIDPASMQGSGDVKYHLGAVGEHESPSGNTLEVTMASNPSHLEAVDPVVEGMARAMQDTLGEGAHANVVPVLVHGDAAFAGQGVVAETLNLSEVPGYDVGGTMHVVVNNQLGFTTAPELGRSSVYATDVAKMVQAPIFHVNGDDPEACVRVVRLAYEFRQTFNKDVVIDMVCYRRYGHNETDEPAFTQPAMYALIDRHRSVRKLYTEALVNRGDLTLEEAEVALDEFRALMDAALSETHEHVHEPPPLADEMAPEDPSCDTSVEREELVRVLDALDRRPEGFHVHPKLERILGARREAFETDAIDWALAEAFALGTLVFEGTPVRLAGQDTRRGTFSQRHAVLVDVETEEEYVPLAHVADGQAPFRLYDSVLSEYAALGFEYGYSVSAPEAFVGWEAQFGDFMNGAQIIIDQFIVAAEDKWGQLSRLALLLPHGFEGQGPEHSSARIERFLALGADRNIRIVYPSSAAQYFHALRRQARSDRRVPLVCFTPKRYLRMTQSRSPVAAFTDGRFELVLDDPGAPEPKSVARVLLSTGKIAHELIDRRDELSAPAAVVRIEQLYPWPDDEIIATLDRYPNTTQVIWVQEEPANMGAWNYAHGKLHRILRDRAELRHVARPPGAAPASGSQVVHEREQAALLTAAFEGL
jgi:2-oxoglutarate decarboxylase